ncbi:hypothetical protein MRX96_043453 [Rhipicephalus microplus]
MRERQRQRQADPEYAARALENKRRRRRDDPDHARRVRERNTAYQRMRRQDPVIREAECERLRARDLTLANIVPPSISAWTQYEGVQGYHDAFSSPKAALTSEDPYLVEWMRSLNLDLMNGTRLATVDAVIIMVRGSLDLGVHVLISIVIAEKYFRNRKRLIEDPESYFLLKEQLPEDDSEKKQVCHGVNLYLVSLIAVALGVICCLLIAQVTMSMQSQDVPTTWTTLKEPHVGLENFGFSLIFLISAYIQHHTLRQYTNGTYGGSDQILYQPHIPRMLMKLFNNMAVGRKGLQYLVAWILYRQLVQFTDPRMFLHGRTATDACYDHIKRVMTLAVTSPVFQSGKSVIGRFRNINKSVVIVSLLEA